MNTPSNSDEEKARQEWLAQERALNEERHGTGVADSHGDVAKYRLIARALRQPSGQPPGDALPADFAIRTAARIETLARASDDRLETWLQRVLLSLLLLAGGVTLFLFNAAANWILAAAFCLALSGATDLLVRQARRNQAG
jgi:hypothetical protein